MSRKLSRSDALEDISNWNTSDVLALLRKNGLDNCCTAVAKRRVDGDELLHLTEGKLALWKSDLTRPLIRSLWSFVEEVRKAPERFVEEKVIETQPSDDHLSDNSSWGTDFEDELADDDVDVPDTRSSTRSSTRQKATVQEAAKKAETRIDERIKQVETESTYANFDSVQDADNVYANFDDAKTTPTKNVSRLHGQSERTLVEQLKEQLKLRNTTKPAIHPKPENLMVRKIGANNVDKKQPQRSFLHDPTKIKRSSIDGPPQRRMAVPPPAEPRLPPKPKNPEVISKQEKLASKPAVTIRNLDLVANLPTKTEESEDEYEQFDEQIIEQNQKKENISRVNSKQSLASGHRSSAESVYQPPSTTSYEEEEEPYEIYESITETPEDNGYYLSPIQRTTNSQTPPPLPAKLPSNTPSNTPSPTPSLTRPEKPKERSPDKKSATLPHSGSSTSLTNERATRPLPPPPDRLSYIDKPWFHNITREQASNLIKEQIAHGTSQDGCFLLRPSAKNVNNPLALALWYRDRVYNVPVRKRPDNRYALGSAKSNEQSFSNVEEIVNFYMREELVLSTGGIQTGSTKLTNTPPK